MYYVYIIKSSSDRYYVGSTENVEERLGQHNSGFALMLTGRLNFLNVVFSYFDIYYLFVIPVLHI